MKAVVAVLKTMSMKAGTYIRDASVKTADAVTEGTKSLRESKFGAQAGETVSSIGTRAAEGSSYVYNVTKTTAQGVVGRLAGSGIPAECAREARYAPGRLGNIECLMSLHSPVQLNSCFLTACSV